LRDNTPPPPINPWVTAIFAPLNLPQITHDLPKNYMKYLPKFDGDKTRSAEEHMSAFHDFTDDQFVEHDDVFMRLFVQTLEGDVRKWFRELPVASIDSWPALEVAFMRQWGEKRDSLYYLNEFGSLKKMANDNVDDFNRSFNNLYNKIPRDTKPSQLAAKVTHVGAFDADFSMVLRERRSPTPFLMQEDAIDIEGNMC
jgi:hypothetical protein